MYKNIFIFTFIFIITSQIILNSFLWIEIDKSILYMFYFCFIYFLVYIYKGIKDGFTIWTIDLSWISMFKYLVLFLIFIILIKYTNFNIVSEIILFFLAFSLLFKLDSRISFFIALIFICLTIIYLIIWDNLIAENMSIYTYYFLVIWVIISLFETSNLDDNKLVNE